MDKRAWRFFINNKKGEFDWNKKVSCSIRFLEPCLFPTKVLGKKVIALGWWDQYGIQREFPLTIGLDKFYSCQAADPHNARVDFIGTYQSFLGTYPASAVIPFRDLSENPGIVVTGKSSTSFLFEVINVINKENRSCRPEDFDQETHRLKTGA